MKKLILIAMAVFTAVAASAQGDAFDVQMRAYKNSLKHYDLQSATVALYNMIALKPERTDLNDSLALLYFAGERYGQSYLLGDEILKANPSRKDMLELVAVSKQQLGMAKESLADYEKLFAGDKAPYYLYQVAILQYQLKRFGECVTSLDQLVAMPDAAKEKVNIRNQNAPPQDVPMIAAAYNVKGICAIELNQLDVAKQLFNKAIELFPDFVLAKGNLQAIEAEQKRAAESAKTSTGTTTPKAPTQPKK